MAFFALASGLITALIAGAVGSLTSVLVEPEVVPAGAASTFGLVARDGAGRGARRPPSSRRPAGRTSPRNYRTESYERPTETFGDTERDRVPESSSAQPRRYAPEGSGAEYYSPRTSAEGAGDDYPQPGSTTELPTVPARERPRDDSAPPQSGGNP